MDIRKLYPSINLESCLQAVKQFCIESGQDRTEVEFEAAIRRIVLTENYCHFDGKVFKFTLGFGALRQAWPVVGS
eukprot:SAG31_NODE_7467_length_1681_cov_8.587863_2_plen_75_part_00